MTGATTGPPVAGTWRRVDIREVEPAPWSTTKWSKQVAASMRAGLQSYGQLVPLVVRTLAKVAPSGGPVRECVDGSQRLEVIRTMGAVKVDVLDVGAIDDARARELHLVLNLGRGKPQADAMAQALEDVIDAPATTHGKAMKEVELARVLPLSGGPAKTVARLRSKGQTPARPHNAGATRSWVDFRFKVDPGAAKVCDDALTQVEQTTQCKRSVAFERICADYLAGPAVGKQP